MKVIAIHSVDLNGYHRNISQWADLQTNGWVYISFNDFSDLITKSMAEAKKQKRKIAVIEIVAHGDPDVCNSITSSNAKKFGIEINTADILRQDAIIILSACNTGLNQISKFPFPKIIAIFSHRLVYGTLGYIEGTYAQDNARCYSTNPNQPGLPAMPGAVNATRINCFNRYTPEL
jgi:hypothetical protein